MTTQSATIASLLLDRREDDHTGLRFEDRAWSYREVVRECLVRARLLQDLRPDGPFHVGVLLQNVPEYVFLLGGAALAGAVVVGINPTRRGPELDRDIRHTIAASSSPTPSKPPFSADSTSASHQNTPSRSTRTGGRSV